MSLFFFICWYIKLFLLLEFLKYSDHSIALELPGRNYSNLMIDISPKSDHLNYIYVNFNRTKLFICFLYIHRSVILLTLAVVTALKEFESLNFFVRINAVTITLK